MKRLYKITALLLAMVIVMSSLAGCSCILRRRTAAGAVTNGRRAV